jgi:hypothetical protein
VRSDSLKIVEGYRGKWVLVDEVMDNLAREVDGRGCILELPMRNGVDVRSSMRLRNEAHESGGEKMPSTDS